MNFKLFNKRSKDGYIASIQILTAIVYGVYFFYAMLFVSAGIYNIIFPTGYGYITLDSRVISVYDPTFYLASISSILMAYGFGLFNKFVIGVNEIDEIFSFKRISIFEKGIGVWFLSVFFSFLTNSVIFYNNVSQDSNAWMDIPITEMFIALVLFTIVRALKAGAKLKEENNLTV